jgi:hypothetical protein
MRADALRFVVEAKQMGGSDAGMAEELCSTRDT